MRKEIRICGFGGQGIVLAGVILGEAAVRAGHWAVQTPASCVGIATPSICQLEETTEDSGCALKVMRSPGSGNVWPNWLELQAIMQIKGNDESNAGPKTSPRC